MTRQPFYDHVTAELFRGSLPDWQREPLDRLIDEGLARERSLAECAYVLATAYHETGRFKYMEEIGKGEGYKYGEPIWLSSGQSITYHGRGFVQLTWLFNYADMSRRLGIDLVNHPDKVKEPAIASKIIWEGMITGSFTGKNLADYITESRTDYVGARRIVNGTDRDDQIAGYAREFEAALRSLDPSAKPETCGECGKVFA